MTATDAFLLEEGPFIPVAHAGYSLLPRCGREGGEVFSYPAELGIVREAAAFLLRQEDFAQDVVICAAVPDASRDLAAKGFENDGAGNASRWHVGRKSTLRL